MNTISIQKTSITSLTTDAIVNAANEGLWAGGGVCGAIFRSAGHDKLQAACDAIGHCDTGSAVITSGFNLPAKYIIHAVGPLWRGGNSNEPKQLYGAYKRSLELAENNNCHSIGFPLISAGIFGYPIDKAWRKAIQACEDFFSDNPDADLQVIFAVLDDEIKSIGEQALAEIRDEELEKQTNTQGEFDRDFGYAFDLSNLATIAPHKQRYYSRYDIQWLIDTVEAGTPLKYVTFWKVDQGEENRVFSQWFHREPFRINGRKYITAEQYMMSEKALLFNDLEMYQKIMSEPDPKLCKDMGKKVKGFNQKKWDAAFPEILFHGNLGKLQSDIAIVDALLNTENAVLIEASPFDDIYGAGIEKKNLLNEDGTLKVLPQNWHKKGSMKQAENHLGFILMGIRDLFCELMGYEFRPGEERRWIREWDD